MKTEYTINTGKANLLSLILIIPIILTAILPFWAIWGTDYMGARMLDLRYVADHKLMWSLVLIVCIVAGFALHELIHGLSWYCFVQKGWKSIKFGILWKQFVLYCHCKEPLRAHCYRIGLMMPTLLLGIIPVGVAWATGSILLLCYGMIMIAGGAGDLLIFGLMFPVNGDAMVKDHPNRLGFVLEEGSAEATEEMRKE